MPPVWMSRRMPSRCCTWPSSCASTPAISSGFFAPFAAARRACRSCRPAARTRSASCSAAPGLRADLDAARGLSLLHQRRECRLALGASQTLPPKCAHLASTASPIRCSTANGPAAPADRRHSGMPYTASDDRAGRGQRPEHDAQVWSAPPRASSDGQRATTASRRRVLDFERASGAADVRAQPQEVRWPVGTADRVEGPGRDDRAVFDDFEAAPSARRPDACGSWCRRNRRRRPPARCIVMSSSARYGSAGDC